MDEIIRDILKPARQYCYNALVATDEKKREYWCARFRDAIRVVRDRRGKLQYNYYRDKRPACVPIQKVIDKRNEAI